MDYKLTFGEDIDYYNHLEEITIYHKKMVEVLETVKDMGIEELQKTFSDGDLVLPRKPKYDLPGIIKTFHNKEEKVINIHKLHSKLLNMLQVTIDIPTFILPKNDDDILEFLTLHNQTILKSQAKLFHIQCAYGFYLDEYYKIFKTKNPKKWKTYIKAKFNITDGYARKLRSIGVLVNKYPKLSQLAISFKSFIYLKKQIEEMLKNEEYATFWKTPICQ